MRHPRIFPDLIELVARSALRHFTTGDTTKPSIGGGSLGGHFLTDRDTAGHDVEKAEIQLTNFVQPAYRNLYLFHPVVARDIFIR